MAWCKGRQVYLAEQRHWAQSSSSTAAILQLFAVKMFTGTGLQSRVSTEQHQPGLSWGDLPEWSRNASRAEGLGQNNQELCKHTPLSGHKVIE